MSELRQLLEYVAHAGSLEVDEQAAVVKGVRVLGLQSANGRSYLAEGVRKALALYEGRAVNADHPARPGEVTTIGRRIGWLSGVRQDADGGLRADLNLLKADPYTAKVLEVARRRPQLMGLSHNATGKTRRDGQGREIVESIEAVHSVDLVADPATVSGLHEGRAMKRTVKELIECLTPKRPGYARGLKEQAEAGVLGPDAALDMPAETSAGDGADHEQALYDAAKAVIDDAALSVAEKLQKIKAILGIIEKGAAAPAEKTEEARRAQQGNLVEQLQVQNKGLRLLSTAGVRLTPILERALDGCRTEKDVAELVEAAKLEGRGGPGRGAQSSERGAGQPQAGGKAALTEGKAPEGGKELARWLTT